MKQHDLPREKYLKDFVCKDAFMLGVDVGNTTIHFGIFSQKELVGQFRLATVLQRTEDEYAVMVDRHLQWLGVDNASICHVYVCSVVPPVEKPLLNMISRRLGKEARLVTGRDFPLPVLYKNREEVGADRLVDALAAHHLYRSQKKPIVVVDFGTATTFDVISERGEYLGGAIAPGVEISTEALFQKAAKLPRVSIRKPDQVIGRQTVESLHAGLYFGFVAQVDGIILRIEKELQQKVWGIATGGLAQLFAPDCCKIQEINSELTLYGLFLLHAFCSQPQSKSD